MVSRSEPVFPVRHNRTNTLRNIFSLHTDNLKYLIRPPLSELGSPVKGKNNAVVKKSQKHVVRWFKDQSANIETICKRQENAYDDLLRLEKEKIALQTKNNLGSVRLAPVGSSEVGLHTSNSPPKPSTTKISTPAVKKLKLKPPKGTGLPSRSISVAERAGIKRHGLVQNLQNTNSENAVEAAKAGVLKKPHFQRNTLVTDTRTANSEEDFSPLSEGRQKVTATAPENYYRSSLEEKRIKLSLEPVNRYILRQDKEIFALQAPYQKKVFEKPPQQDKSIHETLLKQEQSKKREHQKRFKKLSYDLDTLDRWNPMEDIRRKRQAAMPAKKTPSLAAEKWKKLGLLSHWMRAFGDDRSCLPHDVDPDSPEALRLCRYLRIKQLTGEEEP